MGCGSLTELCDNAPLNSFHKRLAFYSSGGPFLDGYVMGMIGIALVQITPYMNLSVFWEGMLGASTMAGMFLGGFTGGWVTDKYGRQLLYTLDLIALGLCSVLQFWAETPFYLFVIRFLLGVAVGADYPIATALMAEFTPKKYRGPFIGGLVVMWAFGVTVAYVVGSIMLPYSPDAWRWMLASAALPATLFLFMRRHTPESPRWLIKQQRYEEARAVFKLVYNATVPLKTIKSMDVSTKTASVRQLFKSGYGTRMLFIAIFWTCAILPMYSVYAFAPKILAALGLNHDHGTMSSVVTTVIFMFGCLLPLPLINKMGRRSSLLHSFFWSAVALFLLGLFTNASPFLILLLFSVYALATGCSQNLQFVYPNELFPTEIRASAVGLASSLSRIGAAIGTYFVPLSLERLGISGTVWAAAFITAIGYLVSLKMAPETKHCTLEEAACCPEPGASVYLEPSSSASEAR